MRVRTRVRLVLALAALYVGLMSIVYTLFIVAGAAL